jgi:hypothetical protein
MYVRVVLDESNFQPDVGPSFQVSADAAVAVMMYMPMIATSATSCLFIVVLLELSSCFALAGARGVCYVLPYYV